MSVFQGRSSKKTKSKQKKNSKSKSTARKKKLEKTNRRDPLTGIDGRKFSKIRQEYHDVYPYVKHLPLEIQIYMGQFMNEWLGANTVGAKFHRSKKDKKKVRDATNARNRDIYSNKRAGGMMVDYANIASSLDELSASSNYEDELIDYLDSKRVRKN